ncbi:MAG TPA: nuclear transport factor 2 family protein [Acidimicrobiales bacterium]|nr:nuclear transport factor 2 family protein [Acidimicrobiales bacterium]
MTDQVPANRGTAVVERYLDRIVARDWDAVATCLAEDVVRVGPFGDLYTPRAPYLAFLSELMPSLEGYSMHVERIFGTDRLVVAELSETVSLDGTPVETPESLVFDLDDDGLISHISIYIQRRP